jgi:hypothetical protein
LGSCPAGARIVAEEGSSDQRVAVVRPRREARRRLPTRSGFPRCLPSGSRPAGRRSPGSAGAVRPLPRPGPAPAVPSALPRTPTSAPGGGGRGKKDRAWSSAPTTQISRSFSQRRVRARFVTWISGSVSAAPDATLRTVGVRPAARSRGTMTAFAPAASALRRQAPRLCGSCTPSNTRSSGGAVARSSNSSSAPSPCGPIARICRHAP